MCTPKPSAMSEHADQQQEAERQHLHRRMRVDEAADRAGRNIMIATATTTATIITATSSAMPTAVITESSENTMSSSMICPMTAANDGATRAADMAVLAFELLVNLARRLEEEEQPAAGKDQIAAREFVVEDRDREERRGQLHDPGDRQQQQDAHHHRRHQPDPAGALLLGRRQLAGEDRDEDHVVDAEDDLEHGQRDERDQSVCGEKCIHDWSWSIVQSVDHFGHQQPRHRPAADDVLLDDFVDVALGDAAVPDIVGIDDDVRALLALIEAARTCWPGCGG